jgi:nucleoside-diphosphate-sugar epimerase
VGSNHPHYHIDAASADHVSSAKSLVAGLAKRPSTGHRHLIHVSGTGVLADYASEAGKKTERVWSDVDDVLEITTSLPLSQSHRATDQAVIEGGLAANVPTAIIAPPTNYGVGRGPLNRRSMQVPMLIAAFLKRGKGFTIGEGAATWGQLSVDDTASAVIFMVNEALLGTESKADWGKEGYYFPENGEFSWQEVATATAQYLVGKGVFASAELDRLAAEDTVQYFLYGPFVWGANCRAVGHRINALGWRPRDKSLLDDLPAQIESELKLFKSA